jgi:hypothetical protein
LPDEVEPWTMMLRIVLYSMILFNCLSVSAFSLPKKPLIEVGWFKADQDFGPELALDGVGGAAPQNLPPLDFDDGVGGAIDFDDGVGGAIDVGVPPLFDGVGGAREEAVVGLPAVSGRPLFSLGRGILGKSTLKVFHNEWLFDQ